MRATLEEAEVHCEMNFLADLARQCDAWLLADGIAIAAANLGPLMGRPEINVLYRYFNLRRRRPPAVPRRIHRSRELTYPNAVSTGFAQVEHELATGVDLWPRLSRRMPRPNENNDPRKNDHLLADWDIHHLHLGLATDRVSSGQIRGERLVLFCILDPRDAYLIQVLDHDAFSDPVLLEIVAANWPQLLTTLPLGPGTPPTAETIKEARRSGVLPLATLRNGSVIAPRGGGFVTSGHSFRALRCATEWAEVASRWETCVRDILDEALRDAYTRGIARPSSLHVELEFSNGQWWAILWEIESRLLLPLPLPSLEPLRNE